MENLFNENMSSRQAEKIFFDYAASHKGEDLSKIKKDYIEVIKKIVAREIKENEERMTE